MAPDIPNARTAGLGHWLARQAPSLGHLDAFLNAFILELLGRGFPIWRLSLGFEILHPEISGKMLIWVDGVLTIRQNDRANSLGQDYGTSPVKIVDETDRPFRRRLNRPSPDLPMLEEFRAEGATDYVIFPLPFLDKRRTAFISIATRAKGGFSASDLTELEMAAALFSPYAERCVLRRIAVDLLETYIGRRTGERIYGGHVERGKIETIGAAIVIADLRGFTGLSDGETQESVITVLDDWFECLADATEAEGGEILKFMGDGLLIIFPVDGSVSEACLQAFRAVSTAIDGLEGLNGRRIAEGKMPLAWGFGLHLGDVAYGNVGGRRRLDFTVIGPAVNLASRLERLTRELDVPLLMSEAFAQAAGQDQASLGHHPIRGLDRTEQVFALPSISPSPLDRGERAGVRGGLAEEHSSGESANLLQATPSP
jgi:adenylate cyclase